jgi:hypothetical protein
MGLCGPSLGVLATSLEIAFHVAFLSTFEARSRLPSVAGVARWAKTATRGLIARAHSCVVLALCLGIGIRQALGQGAHGAVTVVLTLVDAKGVELTRWFTPLTVWTSLQVRA